MSSIPSRFVSLSVRTNPTLSYVKGLDIIAIGADEPNLDILSPPDAVELSSDR